MHEHRSRIIEMDLLLLVAINLLASLRLPVQAAECSVERGKSQYDEHHFVCSNYYEALKTSLQRDRNELYWLDTLYFPPSGSAPHTVHVIATIEVEYIGLPNRTLPANCSSGKQPAFFREGPFWKREWLISLSSSPIPSFAPMDVLFGFDSTLTWAVYAMATGLGSAVSEDGHIRFFINSLPCMPSLEVITEVLEKIMSEMKSIARYHGKPRKVEEADLMVVSSTYAIVPGDKNIILTEPHEIGTKLLISAFVVVQLLGISVVSFLLIAYYESLMDRLQNKKHNIRSIYNSIVFLSLCFMILRVGTFVIACLSNTQFNFSIPRAFWAFTLSSVFTFAAPLAGTTVALIVILTGRHGELKIRGMVQELSTLLLVLAFLQNVMAAVIPVSVLLAMFPGEVISSVALLSSSIVCIAIFIAHIFHLDSPNRERHSSKYMSAAKVVSQAIALMLFIGLLCITFVFYLLLLSRGLDSAGLVGFVVSLIPSLILSYTAKLIGKKILNESMQN